VTTQLGGISEVVDQYDALIVDLWGVAIDGKRAFASAVECLHRWRDQGGVVAFVSNTSRCADNLTQLLDSLGVDVECYDRLLSSGELAYRDLLQHAGTYKTFVQLGSANDTEWLTQCGMTAVADPQAADVVVGTGVISPRELKTCVEQLHLARDLDLPMICANPDREVLIGTERWIGAGVMADVYDELNGSVVRYGKPEAAIYTACSDDARFADSEGVLAIGDSLATDIAGGVRVGLDTALVCDTGITSGPPGAGDPVPRYVIGTLAW